jgi:broad specificity phosphatase PhoE
VKAFLRCGLVALLVLNSNMASAMPAQIIIIRHGEKIDNTHDDLSPRGVERARALPRLFQSDPRFLKHGPPVAIYGAVARAGVSTSKRPVETVIPLAKSLGLEVIDKFDHDQIEELVKDIRNNPSYHGKTVLICWEHKRIPDIVKALGGHGEMKWHGHVFNRAWILDFQGERMTLFSDIPQRLLPGDDDDIVPGNLSTPSQSQR